MTPIRSRSLQLAGLMAVSLCLGSAALAAEHPGDNAGSEHPGSSSSSEHPGKDKSKHHDEHPGKDKSKKHHEHPGKDKSKHDEHPGEHKHDHDSHEHPGGGTEHPTSAAKPSAKPQKVVARETFDQDDYDAEDIKTAMRAYIADRTINGVFRMPDRVNGGVKDLSFVKIHDPVRYVSNEQGYFACTDFHVIGEEGKLYDLDFWLVPKDGELVVYREKIHKDPVKPWHRIGWNKQARYTFVDNQITPINN